VGSQAERFSKLNFVLSHSDLSTGF
jgi:hypothetical protein